MKILIINWQDISNPSGGGAEVHAHEIFKRLVKQGHDITFFACKFGNAPDEEVIDGIKIIRAGSRNTFNFVVPYYYYKIFKKQNFDIIIDDINKIPFFTPIYVKEPLLAISHHFFGTSIFKETNPIFGAYVYFSEYLVNFIYQSTNFAVVSDSTLNEFLGRGFDRKRFDLVYNAFDKVNFPMKVTEKPEYPVITYFGRLKKYKSIDQLLRAFALIHNKYSTAKLELIGRGDFRDDLERLALELGINDKIYFHGFVDDETKIKLLAKSWVVVNTSMKEGWGITNIEANASGTPVVSANVPGLRDSVKENISGLLYEYGNINQLSEKLEVLINDDVLRARLNQGAVEWADNFSWEKSADVMLKLMERTIKEHKK